MGIYTSRLSVLGPLTPISATSNTSLAQCEPANTTPRFNIHPIPPTLSRSQEACANKFRKSCRHRHNQEPTVHLRPTSRRRCSTEEADPRAIEANRNQGLGGKAHSLPHAEWIRLCGYTMGHLGSGRSNRATLYASQTFWLKH